METQNIYFIITSTNEELESNCNFVTDFLSKIPIQKMKIEPLEDLYIYEILEDKFAISKEDRDIVCQLSKLCNGSPSRLRNTFSNMFMKGDISLSKDSDIAQTVFDKLKKDIASNDLSFKYDEFDLFSRTLLKLIIAFKEQASLSLLTKFSSKILEEEFGVKVIEEEILKSAFKLIENGIIGRDDKAYSGHKVKIENSLLRNTIEESIKAEPSYIMFSYWMQKHILENMEDVIASGLSKEMAEYLVAFHSVIGVVPDWVEIAGDNFGLKEPSMVMLEQIRTVNQFELTKFIGFVDSEYLQKRINIGLKKILGFWVERPPKRKNDIRCLCCKCLNDYKSNPAYIIRRLNPFEKIKHQCDKCSGSGYDYLIYDRSSVRR